MDVLAVLMALVILATMVGAADKDPLTGAIVGVVVAAILSLIVWLPIHITTQDEVAELTAFYRDTVSTYEVVAERTEDLVVAVPGDRLTDFAQQKQALAVSERLRELRDKIAWYNHALLKAQQRNAMFLVGGLVYDVPPDLKPIELGAE